MPLRELALAGWQARLPARFRYGIVGALRQTLGPAERWGYMWANPAKLMGPNRQPPPRPIRADTLAELDAIVAEISPPIGRWPPSALRPGSDPRTGPRLSDATLIALRIVSVRRSVSDGEVVDLGKTSRSRPQVPLSRRATAALEALLPRLDTRVRRDRDPAEGRPYLSDQEVTIVKVSRDPAG